MNNILVRSLSGAVFVSLILIPLFFSKEIATGVFTVFMVLGLIEFYKLFDKDENISIPWEIGTIVGTLAFGISVAVMFNLLPNVALFLIAPLFMKLFIFEIWRKSKNPLYNVAVLGLGQLYVVLPFILLVYVVSQDNSSFPILAGMFLLIWMNDTFAFLSGKFFGKTKLIERISPNKTWEGTIGGIIFTVLSSIVIGTLFDPDKFIFWIVSALIIAPTSIYGDLLESLFKRNAKVKDTGSIMPGHGGILDRFDATLFTIPFFLAWTLIYMYFWQN